MGNFFKYQPITQNSRNLKVWDYVKRERGCFGRVIDVEYNDCDEAEIEWLAIALGCYLKEFRKCI